MSATPTSPDRRLPPIAPTLVAALEAAAAFATGIDLHGGRGERVRALPYRELLELAHDRAGRLQGAGFARGDRVGLVAETSADFIADFFACQLAGLIPAPMPLPAPLGGREAYVDALARLLGSCGAVAAAGPTALGDQLAAAADRAGARLVDTRALPAAAFTPVAVTPQDPCYLQFSSGSTRAPTGVLVTHAALMANARAILRHGLAVTARDRALSWLPLFHDMGLVGFLLSPLAAAISVDLLPTDAFVRRPLLWPRLMSETGASISYSPSFGYELCARRAETAELAGLDLSAWRVAGVGGDMVRAGPLEAFARAFAPAGFSARAFVASYGMAEATLALTMAPLGAGVRSATPEVDAADDAGRPATPRDFIRCGPVLPGHQLEVRDGGGGPAPEGRIGKVFVRGPSLMHAYFNQPEATAAVLSPDGWLDTGDLGFLSGGEFTPTGRSKDMILLNGRNVWPQDLEWTAEAEVAALRTGDVAALTAGEDEGAGVVVLVQARIRDAAARARLADEVAAILRSRHGVEAHVRLVGPAALPHTSSGKLRRSEARKLFLAGAFGAPA
ncbi:MAG: fatty acyl-AMP ligase [Caulobacteraceae bacterium]|nr:fatty acyl-AMP ligase [Caulobacter sp.]